MDEIHKFSKNLELGPLKPYETPLKLFLGKTSR
jgi:hypothetical protein